MQHLVLFVNKNISNLKGGGERINILSKFLKHNITTNNMEANILKREVEFHEILPKLCSFHEHRHNPNIISTFMEWLQKQSFFWL